MSLGLSAVVVGAGDIGARLDRPGAKAPLTHAGGYQATGFSLVALVDPNADARATAANWGCPVFGDLDEMVRAVKPDVYSVAVPAHVRAPLLYRIIKLQPRAVIAEKPLSESLSDSEEITKAFRDAGIPLIVNYTRRFTPLWQRMKGSHAMSATIRYAKGLRHNGTHAIDLCRMLFGECVDAGALSRKNDHWPDDPTISAFMSFERCPEVFLQSLDERAFTLFEVDIVGPSWRVIVDLDGRRARHFELRDDVGIPPGKRLVETHTEDTGAASAMINLMRNLREVLDGNPPLCTGEDAVKAQRIAERLTT